MELGGAAEVVSDDPREAPSATSRAYRLRIRKVRLVEVSVSPRVSAGSEYVFGRLGSRVAEAARLGSVRGHDGSW